MGECDGQGACVGCSSDLDCGMPTECVSHVCLSGTCKDTYSPSGTPSAIQVSGDCMINVCDGSGGVTSMPDGMDIADDMNACTADTCSNGVAMHTPALPDTSCGAGMV